MKDLTACVCQCLNIFLLLSGQEVLLMAYCDRNARFQYSHIFK
jgi:hypothetical protein